MMRPTNLVPVHVSCEVILDDPEQYDAEEHRQNQHQDERVDDGQPVDLGRAQK